MEGDTMDRRNKIYKRVLHNRLDWLEPDQELYYERGYGEGEIETNILRESLSIGFRSALAVIICIVIPISLYVGLPGSAFKGNAAGISNGEIVGPKFSIVMPEPPPGAPRSDESLNESGMSIVDYAAELNQLGYLDELSVPAVQAFYSNGVPIEYLDRLNKAEILGDLSYPSVIAYYENDVPVDYLTRLDGAGLFNELTFPAVISFYKTEVTIDYLQRLNESGYLKEFSFPAVTAFYKRGVPVEFLNGLNGEGLLEKLSFPDIIGIYENR